MTREMLYNQELDIHRAMTAHALGSAVKALSVPHGTFDILEEEKQKGVS